MLGRHRLICGDSTLPETYAALMDGRAANLVVTDPPYNVNYEGSAGRIKNDNMDGGKFYEFLLAAFRGMEAVMASDASIYVFHADTEGLNFRRAFADAGFYLSGTCIWKKQSLVLGRSPYQWQHEPVLFGWKKKGKHAWYSDRKQSTIWEFDKPRKNGDHPTMKPIPLMAYPILKQTGARYIVRRLTPRECAKLQGFPPDWCAGLATPEPTEEDIAFWAGVFETHRRIMGKSSKPKSRSQIVKWLGYSPIAMAKNAVGLALATEEYGAAFFANGANPGGVLEHPGVIKDVQRVKESWNAGYQGSGNAHKIALLEDGMKFHAIGIPPEQAQFLETRKFQINEIARIFRIPPHLIGDLEKATFSNIEHQSLEFVKYTLDPWVVRWEQSLMQMLLLPMEKQEYFIKFNLDGLLRGDTKSRNDSYATGRQNGWLSANDIRELEDMNRIPEEEGGDAYLVNGNMISITTAMQQTGGRRTGDAPTEE
ncbi:MAG: phage portal protein [Firmicutes bacterium]|nr:phage portal protein [Bacillota bacterium]